MPQALRTRLDGTHATHALRPTVCVCLLVQMHDVHTLERAERIPSVAIVSTAFAAQAVYQAEALGVSEAERHIVLAEHPISDQTEGELRAKADQLYADLLRQLTSNKPCSAARKLRLRAAQPSALCAAGA